MRSTRHAPALAAALLLAACGGDAPPTHSFEQRLTRLALVEWETGEPSILAASAADELLDVDPAREVEAWRVRDGRLVTDRAERATVVAMDGESPVALARDGLDLDLARAEQIELALEASRGGVVRVALVNPQRGGEPLVTFEQRIEPRRRVTLVRPLDVEGRAGRLTLELPHGTALERVRIGDRPLEQGASPTVRDGLQRDGGLRTFKDLRPGERAPRVEARRSIPARAGAWQVATFESGGDAVVAGALALPRSLGLERARFVVRARPSDSADPDEGGALLHELEVVAAADGDRWIPWRAELPEGDGEWELLFGVSADADPETLIGTWSEPVLIRRAVPASPDLILITGDTLRGDHLAATREALGLEPLDGLSTPWLDGLAARGRTFVDTLATSNATSPSHASILTGHYVRDHKVVNNERVLSEAALTLGEILRERYVCISAVTAGHLDSSVSGLGQGFDLTFGAPAIQRTPRPTRPPRSLEDIPEFDEREFFPEAEWANARTLEAIREYADAPLFLWLHFFDPHTPYRVGDDLTHLLGEVPDGPGALVELATRRAELNGRGEEPDQALFGLMLSKPHLHFLEQTPSIDAALELYAAGVSELDARLAELFGAMESDGRRANVLFTADHGEALGEREIWFEHGGIYTNTLRVPLILAGPDVERSGVSRAPASTLDALPTLVELAGLEVPGSLPGVSLLGSDPPDDRRRWFQHSGDIEAGFREGSVHQVVTGYRHRRGVADQWRDQGTVERLVDGQPVEVPEDELAALRAEVEQWITSPVLDLEAIEADLDEAARAQLRALGYTDE